VEGKLFVINMTYLKSLPLHGEEKKERVILFVLIVI